MNVAIWGAGKFGHYIEGQLRKRNDISLVGFIDTNAHLFVEVNGLKIMTLSQAREMEIDLILVAICDYTSVFTQISGEDVLKIGIIKEKVYRLGKEISPNIYDDSNIVWLKDLQIDKPILKRIDTHIMDGCNLNCRGCSHFSNLFKRGEHIPFESFCKDLLQIAKNTFICCLILLGGEALLNENLTDYIEFARSILPLAEIMIVSNGLLIPKQSEEFFECCRKNDIKISISGYKPTLLMKEDITNILEKNKVDYYFKNDVLNFGKNIDLQGRADPNEAFKMCRESDCHFFRNGKIYKCPFEALGNHLFQYYNIELRLEGGVDIYQPEINWKELVAKLDDEPTKSCCYCGKEERMEWKIEHQPKLEDWIISK